MKTILAKYILILSASIVSFGLIADTIKLTDGSIIKGKLLDQDAESITLKTEAGQVKTIPKSTIARVLYRDNKKDKAIDNIPYFDNGSPDQDKTKSDRRNSDNSNQPVREVKVIERIIERVPVASTNGATGIDPSLNGRIESLENKTDAHSKLIDRDYELRQKELDFRTGELELRQKENQKFEELLKREERLQQEEFEYLKKEKRLRELEKEKEEEQKKITDKRIAELEIRNKRLERYLDMDETMTNYYAYPRSPWQLVYRSALFPGWGERYAREDFIGNFYTITVFSFAVLGTLIEYQAKQARIAINDKLVTDVIINPYSINSLIGTSTALQSLQSTQALKKINAASDAIDLVDSQITLGRKMTQLAVAIYLVQIVHAYIIGVEWAQVRPRDYSDKSLKSGFNFDIAPDNGLRGATTQIGTRSELRYNFSF